MVTTTQPRSVGPVIGKLCLPTLPNISGNNSIFMSVPRCSRVTKPLIRHTYKCLKFGTIIVAKWWAAVINDITGWGRDRGHNNFQLLLLPRHFPKVRPTRKGSLCLSAMPVSQ